MVGPVYNGSGYNDNTEVYCCQFCIGVVTAQQVQFPTRAKKRPRQVLVGVWIRLALTIYEHLTSDIVLGMTVKGLSYSGSA